MFPSSIQVSIVMDSREAREIRIRKGGGVPPPGTPSPGEWVSLDGPGSEQRIAGQIQVNGQLGGSGSR